jgi:dUTPase
MPDSEYLELVSRSSNPLKRFLLLANGVGVIDSDYYLVVTSKDLVQRPFRLLENHTPRHLLLLVVGHSSSEYLELVSRSSNPLKRFLLLANGVGVIDSDYYNNENNEGHIMFQFLNFGYEDVGLNNVAYWKNGLYFCPDEPKPPVLSASTWSSSANKNENNEGHIMFQFLNFGYEDVVIEKGERIGQGIFNY